MFHTTGLDHIALTVRERERSLEWYQRVLGMERRYQEVWNGPHDPLMVCSGDTCLALFPPDTADPLPAPDHNVLAMRHFALRLDRVNFERAQGELIPLVSRWHPSIACYHSFCYYINLCKDVTVVSSVGKSKSGFLGHVRHICR